tara:strand:+ start:516 stop:836 length:321 start_codon:yes stop_codon:yes gene_type:complete
MKHFKNYEKIKLNIGGVKYDLLVADTHQKQILGLSNIHYLPARIGMIFIYDDLDYRTFTMEKTNIKLKIIFLDENYEIVNIKTGYPRQKQGVKSSEKCKYVIEIPV